MIVYRILKYEGEPADIAEMFRASIDGVWKSPGKLLITAAPVEPRIVQSVPMILHALQQVADKRWEPPPERKPLPTVRPAAGFGRPMRGVDSEAVKFLARIDDLLESGEYDWAADTLSGIRETVEGNGLVTDRQRQAVDNIENARRDR